MPEKEYIEREAIISILNAKADMACGTPKEVFYSVVKMINLLPTADVVEVVRCKDCVHWGGVTFGFVCRKFSGLDTKICMHADDFCSYGERKADEIHQHR